MSHAALLLLFAWRLLLKAKVPLGLLVVAVAAGVGLQIPNAANLEGYSEELLNQGMKRATGHVSVTDPSGMLPQGDQVVDKLESLPFVRHTSPRLVQSAILLGRKVAVPIRLVGVDLSREQRATDLCHRVAHGGCPKDELSELLVGAAAAEQAGLSPGSGVDLAVPSLDGQSIRRLHFRVAGVLRGGGDFQEDKDLIGAQRALRDPRTDATAVSSILVFGETAEMADEYRDRILEKFPKLTVRSWKDAAGFVGQAIEGNRKLTWVSLLMVMCAVAVPVLALSYIHVTAERRQIAVLRAVGMTRLDILLIYSLKSVLVAVVGTGVGVLLGLALCWYFQEHPIFNSGGFVVRPQASLRVVLSAMGSVGAIAILAGLWPAMRAAMTNPIEELSAQ